jgi:hypothetical protein
VLVSSPSLWQNTWHRHLKKWKGWLWLMVSKISAHGQLAPWHGLWWGGASWQQEQRQQRVSWPASSSSCFWTIWTSAYWMVPPICKEDSPQFLPHKPVISGHALTIHAEVCFKDLEMFPHLVKLTARNDGQSVAVPPECPNLESRAFWNMRIWWSYLSLLFFSLCLYLNPGPHIG